MDLFEQSVIGGCLLNPSLLPRICLALRSEHFKNEGLGNIYSAMVLLKHYGLDVDVMSVVWLLKRTGDYGKNGVDAALLAQILEAVPTAAHSESHAKIIYIDHMTQNESSKGPAALNSIGEILKRFQTDNSLYNFDE